MLRDAYARGCAAAASKLGGLSMPAMPKIGPIKKTLGLAALGAGGALALGAHSENKRDREGRNLVYAPMTGGF